MPTGPGHPNLPLVVCNVVVILSGGARAAGGERVVYSNTTGRGQFAGAAGSIISDDILMTGAAGCALARYSFVVSGNVDGGGSGPFSVEHALYDDCPGAGGRVLTGTLGQTDLEDEGVHEVSFVVPEGVEVPLPPTFWIGLRLDRAGAGWVGGNPALVGYTSRTYGDPGFGCSTPLGSAFPSSPWGGFNAQVVVRSDCGSVFPAYHAADNRIGSIILAEAIRVAEDVELSVDDCRLTAYELGLRGREPVVLDLRVVDQDNAGLPGEIVPGSALSFTGSSSRLQLARKTFDDPIRVGRRLWVTVEPETSFTSAVVVRNPAQIGATDGRYARLTESGWERADFEGAFAGSALHVSLFCEGEAPLGACCDMFVTDEKGDAVCRDVAELNCPYPPRRSTLLPAWRVGDTCASQPFDPPCGDAACCGADGICANLTSNECGVNGVSWSMGVYCDAPEIACEFVCVASTESCTLPHDSVGCSDPFCCRDVCALQFGDFCCTVAWDEDCVRSAAGACSIPPSNDECAPEGKLEGARLISVPGFLESDGVHATENPSDPGFCCHEEQPGAKGLGTVWYKFFATHTSVRIRTCASTPPATDSLVRVFAVGNAESEETACRTLVPIGCNDDKNASCGFSLDNSQLCLHDLTVGELYYILVAAKTEETRGSYGVEMDAPCNDPPPPVCPCPVGPIEWVHPPVGIVDARRPHPPDDPAAMEGFRIFTAQSPSEADRIPCWSVCESPADGPAGNIIDLVAGPGQSTSVVLDRPITPGSTTVIEYEDGLGNVTRGAFTSHPGNVNADDLAEANDVFWIQALLLGQVQLPFDLASGDIDRSGMITAADILAEIDLLNGAATFSAWKGTMRSPEPVSCP